MSEEWQTKYGNVVQEHARKIVRDIYNDLREQDPLLKFCENARKCVADLREKLTKEIITRWQSVYANILTTIEASGATTN